MTDTTPHDARSRILGSLKSSQPGRQEVRQAGTADKQPVSQLVSQLSENLLAAHAEILHVREDSWPATLATLALAGQLRTWIFHSACETGQAFGSYIDKAGLSDRFCLKRYGHGAGPAPDKTTLFHEVDAGLSPAAAGIAETGTLLLFSSPTQPRLLSLVPPVHAITLRHSTIVSTMAACMATAPVFRQRPLPSNIIFVSGPSKTADIQQTLAYGAHGPKRLIVLLIDDLGSQERASSSTSS